MRAPIAAVIGLLLLGLLALTSCAGGDLLNNPDDKPTILSVRFLEGNTERTSDAAGQQVNMIVSITGSENGCRTGAVSAAVRGVSLVIYMRVSNTQAPLDIDAVLNLIGHDGVLDYDPARIVAIGRPTVVFNQPGSAKGTIRVEAQIQFTQVFNSSGSGALCGSSGSVEYQYQAQVVVLDEEFHGDSLQFPITLLDSTAALCKASTRLCP